MNKGHYPIYAVAMVAAVVAVWVGMPAVFLLFLACPLMMFFMMKGMGGMHAKTPAPAPASTAATPSVEDAEHR